MGTIISAVVTLCVAAVGWWLRLTRRSAADKVASTDHAMLEDAVNHTDPSAVADDMRRGDF